MRFMLCVLAILPLPLMAQTTAQTAQFVDCARAQTQVDLNFCAAQDWREADVILNDLWPLAMNMARSLGSTNGIAASDLLRDAQRAWIVYRDAACAAESQLVAGGSMMGQVAGECLARITRARSTELRLFLPDR